MLIAPEIWSNFAASEGRLRESLASQIYTALWSGLIKGARSATVDKNLASETLHDVLTEVLTQPSRLTHVHNKEEYLWEWVRREIGTRAAKLGNKDIPVDELANELIEPVPSFDPEEFSDPEDGSVVVLDDGDIPLEILDPTFREAFKALPHEDQVVLGMWAVGQTPSAVATRLNLKSYQSATRRYLGAVRRLRDTLSLQSSTRSDASQANLIILPELGINVVDNWREIVRAVAADSSFLYSMDWRRFEDLVGHLLSSFGWSIEPMGYTKDGGIDLIAVQSLGPDLNVRMLVQCKRFARSRKVGLSYVQQLLAVKVGSPLFQQAMLATTSRFTHGAKLEAARWSLELRDHNSIVAWCRRLASSSREREREPHSPTFPDVQRASITMNSQ